jgi:glutathione S-transferase
MKLYAFPPSHHSWRVLTTIALLKADVEVQVVNLINGEHKVSEIQKHNITGRLPILVDDDLSLWESNAIMQYLADKYGPSSLYPRDIKKRADVNRWLSWQMCHFAPPTSALMFQNMLKPILDMGEPDPAKVEEAEETFKSCAAVLDRHLQSHRFICDDGITLADISIASCVAYHEPAMMPWSSYENLQGWFRRIAATEAWRATEPQFDPTTIAAAT